METTYIGGMETTYIGGMETTYIGGMETTYIGGMETTYIGGMQLFLCYVSPQHNAKVGRAVSLLSNKMKKNITKAF